MKLRRFLKAFFALSLAASAASCGAVDNERLVAEARGLNCGTSTYGPFATSGPAVAEAHVGARAQIAEALSPALSDASLSEAAFAEAELVYQQVGALRAAVRAQADVAFPNEPEAALTGERIDLSIATAFAKGKSAGNVEEPAIAAAVIDAQLVRFYALATLAKIREGTRASYDAAYGYVGTGPENDANDAVSLAAIAAETGLGAALFEAVLEGACSLDRALLRADSEAIAWSDDDAYAAAVAALGDVIDRAFARAIIADVRALTDETAGLPSAAVQRPSALFDGLAPSMRARGFEAEAKAIAAMFDAADNAVEIGGDPARALDADRIEADLSAAFEPQAP